MKSQNGKSGNKNGKRGYSSSTWSGPTSNYRSPNLTPSQLVKLINLDHSYALPSAPLEKKTHCFPARLLLQNEEEIALLNEPKSKLENLLTRKSSKRAQKAKVVEDEDIDVCTSDEDPKIPYDHMKARQLMKECEKNVNFARIHDVPENWEEEVNKIGWSRSQRRLFNKMVKILNEEHLRRLAYTDNASEPIYRRLSVDKTAQTVRTLLTEFAWETKLVQWLHGVLMDNLSLEYLAYYLDILQTLKSKVPVLVEKMITVSASGGKCNRATNVEALNLLLKRPWDPFATAVHTSKLKKPPVSAVFVVVPPGPPSGNVICHQRQKSWLSLLAGLGKVVPVTLPLTANKLSVDLYAEMMLKCSKQKLTEVIEASPDKPIYLVGWGSGAIVAATVSLTENVAGVICLAFPLHGTFGTRADVDDCLNDLKHPTLFVIGDRSNNNSVTDMEIFRKGLTCINALSVICQADSYLRVTNYHQKRLLVTQSYVDKCIIDEIAWFMINVPILEDELKVQAQQAQEQVMVLDCPKMIPSNSSSNKRKAYYRPTNSCKDVNSPNYITASKLLQQAGATTKKKQSLPASNKTPGIIKPPIISSAKAPSLPAFVPPQQASTSQTLSVSSGLRQESAPSNQPPASSLKPVSKTAPKLSTVEARLRTITSMGIGTDSPLPSKIPKTANSKDPFTISVATTSAALQQSSTPQPSIPSPTPAQKSWLSVTPVTSSVQSPIVSSVASTSTITTATAPTIAPPPYSPLSTQLPITPILPIQPKEDSQILRRIITSTPSASTIATTSAMINPPIVGLPKDTTATLSPHPIQVVNPTGQEPQKRYAFDSMTKPSHLPPPPPYRTSTDMIRPYSIQNQPQQIRVITPTSISMTQQYLQKTSDGIRVMAFPHHSTSSTGHHQIIRVAMTMPSGGIPPGAIITTTSPFNMHVPPTPRERPLPTRCTDESLSMDCSEDMQPRKGHLINPELFLQLKSTLSVSKPKDKRPPPPSPIPIVRVHDNSRAPISLTRPPVSYTHTAVISSSPSPINVSYTPKYTVFASKDKRVIRNDGSHSETSIIQQQPPPIQQQQSLAIQQPKPIMQDQSVIISKPGEGSVSLPSKSVFNLSTSYLGKRETVTISEPPTKLVSVSLASFQKSSTTATVTNIQLSPSSAAAAIDKVIKKGFEPFIPPSKAVEVAAAGAVPSEETDTGSKNKADLKLKSPEGSDDMASKVTIIEITPNMPPNESSLTAEKMGEAHSDVCTSLPQTDPDIKESVKKLDEQSVSADGEGAKAWKPAFGSGWEEKIENLDKQEILGKDPSKIRNLVSNEKAALNSSSKSCEDSEAILSNSSLAAEDYAPASRTYNTPITSENLSTSTSGELTTSSNTSLARSDGSATTLDTSLESSESFVINVETAEKSLETSTPTNSSSHDIVKISTTSAVRKLVTQDEHISDVGVKGDESTGTISTKGPKTPVRTYEARRRSGKSNEKKQELRKGRSQDIKEEVKSVPKSFTRQDQRSVEKEKDAEKTPSKDEATSKDTQKSINRETLRSASKASSKSLQQEAIITLMDEGETSVKSRVESPVFGNKEEDVPMRKTRAQSLDEKRKSLAESSVDSDKGTDASDNGSVPATSRKRGQSFRCQQTHSSSAETIDLSSDEEPAARVTRSRSRYSSTPVPPGEAPKSPSVQSNKEEDMTMEEDEEFKEARSEDDESMSNPGSGEDTEGQKKRHLKPIHPVTPASLSATRTRKITIPKFYAFGM